MMNPGSEQVSGYRRQAGFTLLELLIAMSLLGLIFAALAGGLRFGTTAWQAGSVHLAENEELQLVHRVLRRQISGVLNTNVARRGTRRTGPLEGFRDRVHFIGLAPAEAMTPGLYRLTLALEPDGRGQALSLAWQSVGGDEAAAGRTGSEPLLRGVASIRLRYFGDPRGGGSPSWVDEWKDIKEIPLVVRITVGFSDRSRRPWPALDFATAGGAG
jgi:general secretion pathway protein J